MAYQGLASPVLGDVAEEPVLDFVPFAGGGRKMTHADLKPDFPTQFREAPLPQPTP